MKRMVNLIPLNEIFASEHDGESTGINFAPDDDSPLAVVAEPGSRGVSEGAGVDVVLWGGGHERVFWEFHPFS